MEGEGGEYEVEGLSLLWGINGAEITLSFFMMLYNGESKSVVMTSEHLWLFGSCQKIILFQAKSNMFNVNRYTMKALI